MTWVPGFFRRFVDEAQVERLENCRQLEVLLYHCRRRHQLDKQQQNQQAETENDDFVASATKTAKAAADRALAMDQTMPSLLENEQGNKFIGFFRWNDVPSHLLGASTASGAAADAAETISVTTTTTIVADQQQQQQETTMEPPPEPALPCLAHEHVLWACRSMSTGCAEQLSDLRDCFHQEGPYPILMQESGTAYHQVHDAVDDNAVANANSDTFTQQEEKKRRCQAQQKAMGRCVFGNVTALQQRRQERLPKRQEQYQP